MLGKNRPKKVRKTFFLNSHEYRDQKIGGTKRAKQFFQKHKDSACKKCWEKNLRKKVRKTFFLYSHEYRVQKIGGTKRAKQFFPKHTISANKNVWKKIIGKKCEKRFFIFTRISCRKNMGKKMRETIFPEAFE